MKIRHLAVPFLSLLLAARAGAQGVTIEHQGLGCIVADNYPELSACFQPSNDIVRARVQFRAAGTIPWYYVEMQQGGACYSALLPKPKPSISAVEYYIDVATRSYAETRTADFSPRVASGLGGCKRRGVVAGFATTATAIRVFAPAGAPGIPAGFSGAAVVPATAAAGGGAASGGGSATSPASGSGGGSGGGAESAADKGAKAASKGAGGGGGGGSALGPLLGVAAVGAAGAGVYVATQKNDDEAAPTPPATDNTGAGIGDISFRLRWSGVDDLDLYVQEPSGAMINWQSPTSSTGGQLDIDSNGGCRSQASSPIENVFWPTGRAPRGTYIYYVQHFLQCGQDASARSFTLEVRRGSTVIQTQTGSVAPGKESARFSIVY